MAIQELKDLTARFEALLDHLRAHGMPEVGTPPVTVLSDEPEPVEVTPEPVAPVEPLAEPQAGG